MSRRRSDGVFTVAIAGLGPKGLYALESLVDAASQRAPGRLVVDVFEPHPTPGAGPVYDPVQPPYLRMNYPANEIDMWRTGEPDPRRVSFVHWWTAAYGEAPSAFPPRADVGRYLAHGFELIRGAVPSGMDLSVIPARVVAAQPAGDRWTVEYETSPDVPVRRRSYDEVLLATGHDGSGADRLAAGWDHHARLVPAVFPTTRWLSRENVPPGSTTAIRGFGLTFIDAALALTEGRGGRFERTRQLDRMRYLEGHGEPCLLAPFSRTGRPMLAKPDPGRFVNLEAIVEPHAARLMALTTRPDLETDLVPAIVSVAADILARDTDMPSAGMDGLREMLVAHLDELMAGPSLRRRQVADEIRQSVSIGTGLSPIDGPAAIGQSWRSLYPAIVATCSHGGLAPRDRRCFRRLSGEMERLSFGPPCDSASKLLALIEAGVVDLTHVADGRIESDETRSWLVSSADPVAVDLVVDAVLPSPGVPAEGSGVAYQIVCDGHARPTPGGRGIDVRPDAGCIGVDGAPTPGLSAVGRSTEDSVIGNDTLSRTMHHHPELWAERVVDRVRETRRPRVTVHSEPLFHRDFNS